MMLDLVKIRQIAQDCSPQELCAALLCQQRFPNFDGQAILTDLAQHPQLWSSFFFMAANESPAQAEGSFDEVIETLTAMSTYRAAQVIKGNPYAPYPANNLLLLAPRQDATLTQLLALGQQWRADEVAVYDDADHQVGCLARVYLQVVLEDAAWSESAEVFQNGVVISYWWDAATMPDSVKDNETSAAGSVLEDGDLLRQLALRLDAFNSAASDDRVGQG